MDNVGSSQLLLILVSHINLLVKICFFFYFSILRFGVAIRSQQAYIIKVAKLSPSSQVASKFKRTPKNDNIFLLES